jgi:hypothetical protein
MAAISMIARRVGPVVAVLAIAAVWAAPSPARIAAVKVPKPAATDTAYVRDVVKWLADPAREGRGVGTAGLDSSAAYLAARMRTLGLEPGGDAPGYLQKFEVTTGAGADCAVRARGERQVVRARRRVPAGRLLDQRHAARAQSCSRATASRRPATITTTTPASTCTTRSCS